MRQIVLWGVGSRECGVKHSTPHSLLPTPYKFLGLLLCLIVVHTVQAHSELLRAEPGPGERVVAPQEIRLRFSEMVTEETAVWLFADGFQQVPDVVVQVDPVSLQEVVASLPPLPPGVYTVQWTAVALDGHGLSGSYMFEVVEGGGRTAVWLGGGLVIMLLLLGLWQWQFGRR